MTSKIHTWFAGEGHVPHAVSIGARDEAGMLYRVDVYKDGTVELTSTTAEGEGRAEECDGMAMALWDLETYLRESMPEIIRTAFTVLVQIQGGTRW